MDLLSRTGTGRDINRHYYETTEIKTALRKPLVRKQIELIRLRNTHPVLGGGEFRVEAPTEIRIEILWQEQEDWIKLEADLAVPSPSITGMGPAGEIQHIAVPDTLA
jgi:sucrose phosphorylase